MILIKDGRVVDPKRGIDDVLDLLIEDGKIKEQGTHQQLLRMKGSYYKLYMSQFEEERAQEILSSRLADSKTDN